MTEVQFLFGLQHVVFATPWTIGLAVFVARWLVLLYVPIAMVLRASRDRNKQRAAVDLAWSAGIAIAIVSLISLIVQRERPFIAIADVALLIPPPLNTSFPSGHTAVAVAIAFALFRASPLLGSFAFVIAAMIAFGRMAVGVHYPSDLLGGVFVGLLAWIIVRAIRRDLTNRDISLAAERHHHS